MATRHLVLRASLVLAASLGGALLVGSSSGCKEEKMGAEKHAEEMAASASAAKAAASDAAPDPKEALYKARKAKLEKTVSDMKADESHIMDKTATPGILRQYFEPGEAGDKLAKELEAKRKKDGDDGYKIKKADIKETTITGDKLDDGKIDVQEATTSKGLTACLLYSQRWAFVDDKWLFKEQKGVKKVDCDQP